RSPRLALLRRGARQTSPHPSVPDFLCRRCRSHVGCRRILASTRLKLACCLRFRLFLLSAFPLRSNMGNHRTLWLVACLAVVCLASFNVVGQAGPPARRFVIRAGHLLDVKTGNTLNNQAIVIEGDKIVSIGPSADAKAAPGAETIDLPNATVLPGLIDAHTHLTFEHTQLGYESLGISVPREALTGAKNARITLDAGFTTVRNVGASGYSDVALRDAINAGDVPGPRMIASGPALGITGGHCDNKLLAPGFQ